MFPSRGTVRYEERGQGHRDVEKVGKHCSIGSYKPMTWDSSVSIVSDYREFVVRFLAEIMERYLKQSIHTGS